MLSSESLKEKNPEYTRKVIREGGSIKTLTKSRQVVQ